MKRILTAFMACVIGVNMSMIAYAVSPQIDDISGISLSESYDAVNKNSSSDLTVTPGTYIEIPLTSANFSTSGDFPVTSSSTVESPSVAPVDPVVSPSVSASVSTPGPLASENPITRAMLTSAKIAVKSTAKTGSKTIKSVSIDMKSFGKNVAGGEKTAYVKVQFMQPFVSVREMPFEVEVYLTMAGQSYQSQGITLTGTLANEIVQVYADTDYVDLSSGQVADVQDNIKSADVYLGNNVTIKTRLVRGKQYYGYADIEPSNTDLDILDKYPDIETVYTLNAIGFSSTENNVKIDTAGAKYNVYDETLTYIGNTTENLVYSTKYYLSPKKLNVTDGEDSFDETDDYNENPPEITTEPTDVAANQTTGGIPDTGTSGFADIALVCTVISATLASAFALKKIA